MKPAYKKKIIMFLGSFIKQLLVVIAILVVLLALRNKTLFWVHNNAMHKKYTSTKIQYDDRFKISKCIKNATLIANNVHP